MKSFKVAAYVRNGQKQVANDFEIEATNWRTVAYRAAKEALIFARAGGLKRPKMIELRISGIRAGSRNPD